MPNSYVAKGKALVASAANKGFFHIVLSSTLVRVVGFLSTIFLPRILSKSDYGLLSYVDGIRGYILIVNGLGISNTVLRFCVANRPDGSRKGTFCFSLIFGLLVDVVLVVGSVVAYINISFPYREAKLWLLCMALLPALNFVFDDLQILLRAALDNKRYSILSFTYSALTVFLQILLALRCQLVGVVVARHISLLLSVGMAVFFISKLPLLHEKIVWPDRRERKKLVIYGLTLLVANASLQLMSSNETLFIGWFVSDVNALADYRVASYILQVTLFVVQAEAIFVTPYFALHSRDIPWMQKKYKQLFWMNAAGMLALHGILFVLAKFAVLIVFGEQYLNAVPLMRIQLVSSLFQSVLRVLPANILATIGQEKYSLKVNFLVLCVHTLVVGVGAWKLGITGVVMGNAFVYLIAGILMSKKIFSVLHPKKSAGAS